MKNKMQDSKRIAKLFHDTYEELAPEFGYTTREDTREFNPESANGKLMIAVCKEVVLEELDKAREEGYKKGYIDGQTEKTNKPKPVMSEFDKTSYLN